MVVLHENKLYFMRFRELLMRNETMVGIRGVIFIMVLLIITIPFVKYS